MDKLATVLIVDDLPDNIELLSYMLSDSFNTLSAGNGKEALEILRARHNEIDVVLMDFIMPVMDGCETLSQMKADPELRSIPVVMITSDDDPKTKERAFSLGAVDFVPRGADISALNHRIRTVLRLWELDKIRVEHEKMKNELQTEKHLCALMDNIPGGVAVIETDGNSASCSFFNDGLPRLMGMTSGEFADSFLSADRPEWLKRFIETSAILENFSYIFGLGDSKDPHEQRWIFLIAGKLGEKDGKKEIYCVFIDVNDEKRKELLAEETGAKLRASENHFEAVLNNAPGGIVYAEHGENGGMKTLFASKGLAEMLDYPDSESCMADLAKDPCMGISEADALTIKMKMSEALAGGKRFKHSFRCRTKKGDDMWVMLRGQLVNIEGDSLGLYAFITNITNEKKTEEELRITAYFDTLTGLYNRSAFIKSAQQLLDSNPLTEFSIMKLDIGGFKVINDILGREVGDRVLIRIADVLRQMIGRDGVYARFFADNFMMMIPYSERSVHPQMILDRVQKAIADGGEVAHDVQIYIGVYRVTDRNISVDNMVDRASIACRSINGSFREHIAYYDENMRRKMLEEQEIRSESRRALENGEFYVCYQPIYGIKAKKFVSAEALVRWNHPTKGMIPPARFIPIFEKNGFIAELDLYVLEQVCIYMKKRADNGLPPFPISVNVSRMSLYNPNIFSIISKLTTKYKVDPKYFRIEITESAYNDNPTQLLDTIGRLRGKCYPVLMDDFGSGYSSLNTLKDIPIDILKLDMKFMQGFEKNGRVGTIVTAIARMSKWLNVPMLAEGVETKEQYDFLVSVGCSYIQGFYFSRPVPEKDFTDLAAMDEVSAAGEIIESGEADFNVNELLGSNPIVSKFINSVFGGLGIYEMVGDRLELIRVNDGYLRIMGYSVDDLTGENIDIWQHVHPDDVEISRNACLEAMKTDKAVRATVRRFDRDGKLLYLEGIHRRLGGSDDSPIFCIAFNDINEQLRSDKIIERSKSRTEEVLNATNSIIVDVDFEMGEVFFVGDWDHDARLDKIDIYSAPHSPFVDIVHPDDLEKAERFHAERVPGRQVMEIRLKKRSDGEYYWWRFSVVRHFGADGKQLRLVATAMNINTEKTSRLALQKANMGIDEAMTNLSVGILILEISDEDKPNILLCNDMFRKIVGKSRVDGDFLSDLNDSVSEADIKRITDAVKKGSAHTEYRVEKDDGSTAWVDLTLAPSHLGGKKRTYMAVVSDVTERHKNRANLDAIVRSLDSGFALVSSGGGKLSVDMANDKFYDILSVQHGNEGRIAQIVSAVLSSGNDTADVRIRQNGEKSIVRVHVEKADAAANRRRWAVTVSDVTQKRAEIKQRISERLSNADSGLYDEIYEMNLRAGTLKLVMSRRIPGMAEKAKPFPISAQIREWTEKFIHPSDVTLAMKTFLAPMNSPDFEDSYCEIRMKDAQGDGEYHLCGIAVVRSKSDACMMFMRDCSAKRRDEDVPAASELDRLLRVITGHTRLCVVEYDCITNRVICSANLEDYSTPGLSEDGMCGQRGFGGIFDILPDDRTAFDEFLKTLCEEDAERAVTVHIRTADGEFECRRLTAFLKRDGGSARIVMAVSRAVADIQELTKAGDANDFLHKTVRNIPLGIGIFRIENGKPVPVYIGENVYEMYGIDKDKADAPVLPAEKLMEEGELYNGAEGEYALESYHADGSKFWLSVKYHVIEEQGTLMLYAALSDVSDRVESLRHEAAEQQMYQVLLSETGTVLFDYKNESGTLSYFRHDGGERGRIAEVERLLDDPSEFTLLTGTDRANFIVMLRSLIEEAGSCELPVRIEVDGYPRRYKVFMKSVCDPDGKVYEIIGKMEDAEDEMARLDKIRAKAMYDSLCVNIYNKATTEELIRGELEQSTGGALLMIDIDDFKSINDTLGHLFGDEFLKKFAGTVKSVFRDTDIVGRYGGDEFFVFMPHVSAALAEKKGSMILERVMNIEVPMSGGVKSSIGVAAVTPENRGYSKLLKQADSALYQAKNRGKNCVVVFDPSTMTEETYRTAESSHRGSNSNVVLSSNPNSAASVVMRVFSALYSCSDIDEGISQMIELVGKTYDISRVYIFEDSENGLYTSNTFEWCAEGVTSEKDSLQNVSYEKDLGGSYKNNMNDDGIFYCHDVSELEDKGQREILERQGIKSVLQCSITEKGEFKGFVGFDECRGNRFWTQDQIDSLAFLAKVLSVFLMRGRSENKNK